PPPTLIYTLSLPDPLPISKLVCQFAAQRACDEKQRFAILHRLTELAVRAREQWWFPRHELIRFDAASEKDGMPSFATQLALQLSWADGRHRMQGAQAEKVEPLELLSIQRQL